MLIVKESQKSVQEIKKELAEVAGRHKFGVLGTYNLKEKLNDKGVPFERECLVLEVCNPQQAGQVLETNIAIATALPCRVAVYQEDGQTKLATIRPTALLGLFPNPDLTPIAGEVERVIAQIMDDLA